MANEPSRVTVGELAARFVEACGTRAAFGVISIHNMPILDAFHRRGRVRFVSARGEAGACNMADAYARVSGVPGVCVTSTGTGAGNAAGALIEAYTASTPLLHLTGQIESEYLDRNLGYIHEAPAQLAMLQAVGKAAFRIARPEQALATLREAARLACTPPCGPVSVEIPIDVQAALVDLPSDIAPVSIAARGGATQDVERLADELMSARRPLLWLGGGARGARAAIERLLALGWGVVTSVQGRGVIAEDHPATLGPYNLQKPAEALYADSDAMLVAGSRLRSNETLRYKLQLPEPLYRIDADPAADGRAYPNRRFVQGDAQLTLDALASALEARGARGDPSWQAQVTRARSACEQAVRAGLGPYTALLDAIQAQAGRAIWWVRDITLSNTMWGNRAPVLDHPRAGVHALGGGIGQGLAMAVGAAVANAEHGLARRTVALAGDGGFMLNLGELACAAQEGARFVLILMNDRRYGVIRNIQDDFYGGRHCYVDLRTPDMRQLCASLGVRHWLVGRPEDAAPALAEALAATDARPGPAIVEIDMPAWGPFTAKFAGPPLKKD